MSRVAIVGPGNETDFLSNAGIGVSAVIETAMAPKGVAYIVDPDEVKMTNLWTGEVSYPIRDLLGGDTA